MTTACTKIGNTILGFMARSSAKAQHRIYGLAIYKMQTIAEYRFLLKREDTIQVKLIYHTKELKVKD